MASGKVVGNVFPNSALRAMEIFRVEDADMGRKTGGDRAETIRPYIRHRFSSRIIVIRGHLRNSILHDCGNKLETP
jgi:hypothetical protein